MGDRWYFWLENWEAVKFQRYHGLVADGKAGNNLDAMGLGHLIRSPSQTTYQLSRGIHQDETYILAQVVNGEPGGAYIGQVTWQPVLNRVRHPPSNTISGVIFQPGAFTAVADGQMF